MRSANPKGDTSAVLHEAMFVRMTHLWDVFVTQGFRMALSFRACLSAPRSPVQNRIIAIASVAALHALVALVFFSSLIREPPIKRVDELQIALGPAVRQAEPDVPKMPDLPVPMPMTDPPQIVIQTDEGSQNSVLVPASMILAPRQDPTHPNALPQPSGAGSPVHLLVLRILVLPTGLIGDTVVLQSSGQRDEDAKTVEFVEENWRFLPAMLQDKAVEYWTVVSIRI